MKDLYRSPQIRRAGEQRPGSGGWVTAVALATIGSAAALSWIYLRKSEPAVDERTRRRLAPRGRNPQPIGETDNAHSPS